MSKISCNNCGGEMHNEHIVFEHWVRGVKGTVLEWFCSMPCFMEGKRFVDAGVLGAGS